MDGRIVGDAFICLQEQTGRLGPQVMENLFPAPNLLVTCSTSGKLTKTHVKYYVEKLLYPAAKIGIAKFPKYIYNSANQLTKNMHSILQRWTKKKKIQATEFYI